MISKLEYRLKQFVDRDREMARFCDFIDGEEKLVTVVVGPGGIGKSSLKDRMIHECSLRKLTKVEIQYTDDNLPEYMSILRTCRDNLGAEHFSLFTDLINYYTSEKYTLKIEVKGNISVGNNMQISGGATVGNIAGVVVSDNNFTFPRSDLAVSETEQRTTLTQRFLACLGAVAAAHQRIVIFIDGAEKMNPGTARWLWTMIVPGLTECGATNVRLVFLGREEPDMDGWTREITDVSRLQPLTIGDVELYLEKRGIAAADRPMLATFIFANSDGGNPLKICNQVDTFIAFKKQAGAA